MASSRLPFLCLVFLSLLAAIFAMSVEARNNEVVPSPSRISTAVQERLGLIDTGIASGFTFALISLGLFMFNQLGFIYIGYILGAIPLIFSVVTGLFIFLIG